MRILLVDDCPTTRKLISLYLKSTGYEIITAENGIDAIEKLGKHNINLILSDLNMPYMDGIELLKNLRADPEWRHIPVLMITTEADEAEKKKAYDAGANGYLVKPITAGMITQSIKSIIRSMFKEGGTDA